MMERRRNAALYFLHTERDHRNGADLTRAAQMRLMEGGLFTLVAMCGYQTMDPEVTASNIRFVGKRLLDESKSKKLTRVQKQVAAVSGACLSDAHVAKDLVVVPISPDPKWRPKTVMFAMRMMLGAAAELAKIRGTRLPNPLVLVNESDTPYRPDLRRGIAGA